MYQALTIDITDRHLQVKMSTAGLTTQGMSPVQLDLAGQLVLGGDPLRSLAPWFIGIWLDTLLLGAMLALFAHWVGSVAKTDRRWVKVTVVSISIQPFLL